MSPKLRQALNQALEVADDDMLADIMRAKRHYLDNPEHADPELMLLELKQILRLAQIDKESLEEKLDKIENETFDIEEIFKAMRELQE